MAERYVVQGAVGGDGSLSLPWGSLNEAEAGAIALDNINVAAGTYLESGGAFNGFETAKELTWVATGLVTVRSASTSWTIVATSNVLTTFDGFTWDGELIDSPSVVRTNTSGNNLLLKGGEVANINPSGNVYSSAASTSNGVVFDGVTINVTSSTWLFDFAGNTDFKILNCDLNTTCRRIGIADSADFEFNGNNAVITITGADARLIGSSLATVQSNFKGNNITVSGLTVTYIIDANRCLNSLIEDNVIDATGVTDASFTTINVRSSVSGSYPDPIVRRNTVVTNHEIQPIILVGTDAPTAGDNALDGATIYENNITSLNNNANGTHGIELGYNTGEVMRNRVITAGFGIVMKGTDDYANVGGCNHNTIINSTFSSAIRVKGYKNMPCNGNTIYVDNNLPIPDALLNITVNTESANTPSNGTKIFNQIISNHGSGVGFIVSVDATSDVGMSGGGNLYFESGTGTLAFNVAGVSTNLADWNTFLGGTGIEGDPLYVDATNGNFELQAGSPAIGIGVKFWGNNPRPKGENGEPYPDIGIDAGSHQSKWHPSHPGNPNFVPL